MNKNLILLVWIVISSCTLSKVGRNFTQASFIQRDIDGQIVEDNFEFENYHQQGARQILTQIEFCDTGSALSLLTVCDKEIESMKLRQASVFRIISCNNEECKVVLIGFTDEQGQVFVESKWLFHEGLIIGFPSYRFLIVEGSLP